MSLGSNLHWRCSSNNLPMTIKGFFIAISNMSIVYRGQFQHLCVEVTQFGNHKDKKSFFRIKMDVWEHDKSLSFIVISI